MILADFRVHRTGVDRTGRRRRGRRSRSDHLILPGVGGELRQAALAAEMEGLPVMDMRAGGRRIDRHATDRVLHFNGGRAAAVWVIGLVMAMRFVRADVRCLAGTAGRACRRARVCQVDRTDRLLVGFVRAVVDAAHDRDS